jgi:TonB family protein
MKSSVSGVVAVLALAASAAHGAPPKPQVVTQPDWIARPTSEDLSKYYPKAAYTLFIEGRARVSCEVDAFGGLQDCRVTAESPAGMGFGSASLAMAPLFRMRPMTRDGRPVAGGKLTVPIDFRMGSEPDPAPAANGSAPSPQAMALARRYMVQMKTETGALAYYDQIANELEFIGHDGTPVETRGAAASAIRAAAKADIAQYVEGESAAVASLFSVAELEAMVASMESPAGEILRSNADYDAVAEMLRRDLRRRASAAAAAAFCHTRSCDFEAALAKPVAATITAPAWSRGPGENDVEAARPAVLGALGLGGVARLVCVVDALATPTDCAVDTEAPAGLGVGSAVIRLASQLRLHPLLMSQGAQGETVAVTVAFPQPEPEDLYSPPPPRTAKALALARQLDEAESAAELSPGEIENLKKLEGERAPDADPAVVAEAVAALRVGVDASHRAYEIDLASARAAIFTEEQLAAAVAFYRTPAGKALRAKDDQLRAAYEAANDRSNARLMADARVLFCKDRACEPNPPLSKRR